MPADLRLIELFSNVFRVDQVSMLLPWNLELALCMMQWGPTLPMTCCTSDMKRS